MLHTDELERWLAVARTACPGILVQPDALLRRIRVMLGSREPPALRGEDLVLAAACLEGDPAAMAHLDRLIRSVSRRALARVGIAADLDEVCQQVRSKLLLGQRGPPKLGEYSGHGPLSRWLQTVVLRQALNERRHEARAEGAATRCLAADLQPLADPEIDFLRRRYREDFDGAFAGALAGLSDRERSLLRLHLIDGLSYSQLAVPYQVERSTICRWLRTTREKLVEQTRARLAERLALSDSELDSLMRLLCNEIDVSIGGLLRSTKG
ncbi:MAG: sigma-70 family RNA polymerase sigma factor [Deltaproteobacteria bacterium]|nr:sigma-70 family RNA polymerase sigma factor [Deltaproteobacteria bacterium]